MQLQRLNNDMKNIINSIVSTNKGWIVRQVLKYVAMGGAIASSWLISRGADASNADLIISGATTIITGALELGLSKLASKVAATN